MSAVFWGITIGATLVVFIYVREIIRRKREIKKLIEDDQWGW